MKYAALSMMPLAADAQMMGMQYPQGGMASGMGNPMMGQAQMDPNMAAMLYQQQMAQQQQAEQERAQIEQIAAEREELLAQQEQLLQMLQAQQNYIGEQEDRLFIAENPNLLDPESVDAALCLSASEGSGPWASMKQRLNNALGQSIGAVPLEQMRRLLDNVVDQFVDAEDVSDACGMGVLSLHLLNAITLDNTTESQAAIMFIFSEFEPLSSPVLGLLFDLPWESLHRSGWPLFSLLGQLRHRKTGIVGDEFEEVNGFNHTATHQFWKDFTTSFRSRDFDATREHSEKFLDAGHFAETPSQLAMLTGFLSQGMNTNASFREALVGFTQNQFKTMVPDGQALDIVLGSQWPFFEVLQNFWLDM